MNSAAVMPSKVLYVTERSPWGQLGYKAVAAAFDSVTPVFWSHDGPKPDLTAWEGDWIVAFKADLILSGDTLARAKKGAINFHPSPPRYRGLGGYWWALHNGDKVFGVTVHHMDERIDHGAIIKTDHFRILPKQTETGLKERAAIRSLILLNKTLAIIQSGKPLAPSGEQWGLHLYTSKELAQAKKQARATQTLKTIHDEIASIGGEKPETRRAGRRIQSGLALS